MDMWWKQGISARMSTIDLPLCPLGISFIGDNTSTKIQFTIYVGKCCKIIEIDCMIELLLACQMIFLAVLKNVQPNSFVECKH